MKEILDFIAACRLFFLATDEGGQPRVRPMGVAFEYKGKLSFCTNNTKKVFAQMKANPKAEICASNGEKWLRVTGTVVFSGEREAKEKALEAAPMLKNIYKVDDGIFEIFQFENAVAVFEDMKGNKKELKL
ncbi:MAG: pyridoxamine 5'-phosphate oxidase family protein [Spirochaetaceae bacterium]|nr:pyridoxamine 5'-phosphate oxidase family protein [Spirochaetaceae bacterium]